MKMELSRNAQAFQPVTVAITLTSVEELQALRRYAGKTSLAGIRSHMYPEAGDSVYSGQEDMACRDISQLFVDLYKRLPVR